LRRQNEILLENSRLREDVERITRHDLKSPITAIINLPQLLIEKLDDRLDDEYRETLQLLEEQGYRMLDMVNLALDLYKMEEGTYVCRAAPVDLLKIIRKIRKETALLLTLKRIELRLVLEGSPAGDVDAFVARAEDLLCYSMFANLIKNAVEASPEDATITVACAYDDLAAIAIHNHGAVPAPIRERFFEKYATSGKDRGTGLGTYSAKLIAQTQGGSITMTTSEESGTTVTVHLPRPVCLSHE
jgi:signal transduction histidine kinase